MTGSKFQINDKIAIVTGGAGLLVHNTAMRSLEQVRMFIADVDSDKIKTTCEMLGKSSTPLLFDVTDQNSIKSGLEQFNQNIHGSTSLSTMQLLTQKSPKIAQTIASKIFH